MNPRILSLLMVAALAAPASAGTVLFSDTFDAPDTTVFDTAPLTGRLGGTLANDVKLLSRASQQQSLLNNRWRIFRTAGEGRLRFHTTADPAIRFNWAAGTTGAAIIADGGLRLEFDWLTLNTTDTNWIEASAGLAAPPADPGQPVNEAQTDLGILFRHNGATQFFDNGTATAGAGFPATYNRRHVVIEYAFTSFADGASVTGNAWVNGTQVVTNKVFDWNNNGGALYLEMGSHVVGDLIDNLKVSTLSAGPDTDGDSLPDSWEIEKAGNLTALSAVTGPPGGEGSGDFDNDGLTDLQEYNLGLRTFPGLHPQLADSDADGLNDGLEVNPTAPRVASSPVEPDTDLDGLSDAVETNTGTYVNSGDTGSNPTLADTDGDNFPDGYEALRSGDPVVAGMLPTLPAGVSTGIVTDEASTGISSTETFTHKMSGGAPATINGVALDVLNATTTPPNFIWDGGVGGKSIIGPAINNGNATTGWFPATGNVTGTGNLTMFGTFAFSGNGGTPFCRQTYTLSGLEPGRPYEFRVFIRKWDNSTVRPEAVKFINGAQATDVFVLLDRPAVMTGSGNSETAYYLSYSYTPTTPTLTVEAMVPRIPAANGSYHLYGMTNRVAGPPADVDADGISDYYETTRTGGLTTLGPVPADADNDGLTDVAEYGLSTTYPALNPTDDDSDNDGLIDGAEVNGTAGSRPATNPVKADTDNDGLSDLVETNTGFFVSLTDTGSNPLLADTDTDAFSDSAEAAGGTDPNQAASRPALPPGVSFSVLTDDASTGISASNTYTHKISGGRTVTINGVVMDLLSDTVTPANFTWDNGTFARSNYAALPGTNNWVAATGNVTGSGLIDLLTGFTYSSNGAEAGSTQKFTLSGLTPGLQYELKLFTRAWDQGGSGRPIDLKFTNGAEVANIWPGDWIKTDRPGGTTTTGNNHVAYAIVFNYVAQGTTLVIDANVPAGAAVASGSFHMYGLTNRESGPPPVLDFLSVVRAPNGANTTLTIASRPGRTYAVDFSTNMVDWFELADAVPSTGLSTVYVDSAVSNLRRVFYKVRDVTP